MICLFPIYLTTAIERYPSLPIAKSYRNPATPILETILTTKTDRQTRIESGLHPNYCVQNLGESARIGFESARRTHNQNHFLVWGASPPDLQEPTCQSRDRYHSRQITHRLETRRSGSDIPQLLGESSVRYLHPHLQTPVPNQPRPG